MYKIKSSDRCPFVTLTGNFHFYHYFITLDSFLHFKGDTLFYFEFWILTHDDQSRR